jgi:hypothetical protein
MAWRVSDFASGEKRWQAETCNILKLQDFLLWAGRAW